MKKRRIRGGRFDGGDVNPMDYLSNLSDAMLVLAVGMMLALILHWNVDISTSGGTMSNSGQSYAADGQGGHAAIDRSNALSFTQDDLAQMETQEYAESDDEGMEKLGEVYYDAATGKYYIIEDGNK